MKHQLEVTTPTDREIVMTRAFDERDGLTMLTVTLAYESTEARDIALASGMDEGCAAGYERLNALLA